MQTDNKKVRGAKFTEYKDIQFRSLLEYYCYKKLEESGLEFSYEPEKFKLWTGLKLQKLKVFAPRKLGIGRYGKELIPQTRALLDMTYTPDFLVEYKGAYFYFDVKGKENDVYPIKKKMFLKYIEELSEVTGYTIYFFEPHSVKQMLQAIEIIKAYEPSTKDA